MKVNTAFDTYQKVVNAPIEQVKEARRRRDLFKAAFEPEDEIVEVRPSGSLARGTQHDPIKDVDTILIFHDDAHSNWGQPGTSAEEALAYVGIRVNALLGTTGSHAAGEVRLAGPRDHAVKCFLDDPDADRPFTVDAMPALLRPEGLLIPEVHSDTWVLTDPSYLIELAKDAHAAGGIYAPLVRVLKRWRRSTGTKVSSLLMEVLALEVMPTTGDRSVALNAFFAAASVRINDPVCDPANLCGPIQPDLDVPALRAKLEQASDLAARAIQHERWDQPDVAIRLWGEVFGADFPKPPSTGGDGGGGGGTGSAAGLGGLGGGAAAIEELPKRPVKDINQG